MLAIIALILDKVLLKTYLLYQSEFLGMLYWVDCPMHFLGGLSAGLILMGLLDKFPSVKACLGFKPMIIYGGVFVIAVLWEVKEVFEGVPALERKFNPYIGGLDFYYFNLIKDTLMALIGANRAMNFWTGSCKS